MHEYAYDNLMIGNALTLLPTLADDAYDLVLANPLENHRSHRAEEDLRSCGFVNFLPGSLNWIAIARK
ncbi:hypothetical protein [uncultured Nitrosomonas sp.]|uniref:hypothetical protein n=1 Tax=uncultured Nitrosomonas sp. TaxID=156424 RepID=UPI0025CC6EAF|nr:hypothetical protein [uncultured Nitrosomonas sp.]